MNFPEFRNRIPAIIAELLQNEALLLIQTVSDVEEVLVQMNRFPQSPPSLPLTSLITGSENNARRDLTSEMVAKEAEKALFVSPLPQYLVNNPFPLYDKDAHFGSVPAQLPATLVIQGTLDPNTPFEGAQAHSEMLADNAELLHFTTVHEGAHFLLYTASECFVQVVSAFVTESEIPASCDAQVN